MGVETPARGTESVVMLRSWGCHLLPPPAIEANDREQPDGSRFKSKGRRFVKICARAYEPLCVRAKDIGEKRRRAGADYDSTRSIEAPSARSRSSIRS